MMKGEGAYAGIDAVFISHAHRDHFSAVAMIAYLSAPDHAFPPYWFLTSPQGRNILTDDMNVAISTGIHVPIKVPADLKESGQDYFSLSGETREIGE